ncbi:hypothetical protein EHF33_16000 [Deinococcus psychrotolerans]|uniref:Uncharacterized protein n=1 Tax=Deinococcus psychrotolerans TaxID=2489213 RepID=A0A3G8YGG0_9DEIO|nr:PcfJ domain-containing protein [Deinococcus psychrotolerans]AZI44382.1 hypothetical protein EHF33_16000 [Deinococcus psychrotolerans]
MRAWPDAPQVVQALEVQVALGRSATHVVIGSGPELPAGAVLHAGPRAVRVTFGQEAPLAWQRADPQQLDAALVALHGQILEEADQLPELLVREQTAEQRGSRAVERRLGRMLALRGVLDLSAAWDEGKGWDGNPKRAACTALPWHPLNRAFGAQATLSETWQLHDLRRWSLPHPQQALAITAHVTCAALLQQSSFGSSQLVPPPLPRDPAARLTLRLRLQDQLFNTHSKVKQRMAAPALLNVDPDADSFVRRVRWALAAVLDPALLAFDEADVRQAVQGALGASVALRRLLPKVHHGPVAALAVKVRRNLQEDLFFEAGKGSLPARRAGKEAVRRSCWTAAWAADAHLQDCLAAEAIGGPLHQLIPGLDTAGPTWLPVRERVLDRTFEELKDLFAAVLALLEETRLPLQDLSALLTGRGVLRLGSAASAGTLQTAFSELQTALDALPDHAKSSQAQSEVRWAWKEQLALRCAPGLEEAISNLKSVMAEHHRQLRRLKTEVCQSTGVSESALEEVLGGEERFTLDAADLALERRVVWADGCWDVRVARHPQELVEDGQLLGHCVGWGGCAQSVRAGHIRIIRILEQLPGEVIQPRLTLELTTEPNRVGWTIVQARGFKNRSPTVEEQALLNLWSQTTGVQPECSPVPELQRALQRLNARTEALEGLEEGALVCPPQLVKEAAIQFEAACAAQWTHVATRQHQETLRRIARLRGRAQDHLEQELARLHAAGDPGLVGTLHDSYLLPGVPSLQLPVDQRSVMQPEANGVGIQIAHRSELTLGHFLEAYEVWQTLTVRTVKRSSNLGLLFKYGTGSEQRFVLTPQMWRSETLPPQGQSASTRRQEIFWQVLEILKAVMDVPLGPLEAPLSALTRRSGATLKAQFTAWSFC